MKEFFLSKSMKKSNVVKSKKTNEKRDDNYKLPEASQNFDSKEFQQDLKFKDNCIYSNLDVTSTNFSSKTIDTIVHFGIFRGLGINSLGKSFIGHYKPSKKLVYFKILEKGCQEKFDFSKFYFSWKKIYDNARHK